MTNPQVNPQVRAQAKLHIYEGMSVDTVKRDGSDGQKIAVTLFDTDGNGKLEGAEVTRMNNCTFKSEPNKLTIWEKQNDGTKSQLEIKYKNLDELYNTYKDKALNLISSFGRNISFSFNKYQKDGQEYCKNYVGFVGNSYKKISIDMPNAKVTVDGADGNIYGRDIDLTVKNSDAEKISTHGGKIKLENTKNKGLLWDSPTRVKTNGKTVVKQDANSEAEVRTEK